MFDCRQSRLKRRRQFEEQTWKTDENFSAYYHEKIILANRVIMEYLIGGISNTHLWNQARLQQFDSGAELLAAFENISLTETKDHSERDCKTSNKDYKGVRAQMKKEISPKKNAAEESSVTQAKIRCYNCSKFSHISKDCKLPKREKGICLKCGKKSHMIGECIGKVETDEVNCIHILIMISKIKLP